MAVQAWPCVPYQITACLRCDGHSCTAPWSRRRAAAYVDRILNGTHPGELPIQASTKYELVINLKIAETLGLEIPPTLRRRGDGVEAELSTHTPARPTAIGLTDEHLSRPEIGSRTC
jgi:hypothetical protein